MSAFLLKSELVKIMYILFTISMLLFGQFASVASALSEEQKRLYNQNILYYDLACSEVAGGAGAVTAGAGAPDGAIFPNLPPDAMATAIDKYIEETNPSSKLKGLGSTIVAGAKNSNVSPFLIVAIAQKESSLASPTDFNVKNGNNSFGRSATTSQPNFQGARLWYKWDSVKASVDHTAPENKNAVGGGDVASYIREQYPQDLDSGNIASFFSKYAPEFENDTTKYINDVGRGIGKMVSLTQGGSGSGATAVVVPDDFGGATAQNNCECGDSGSGSPSDGAGNADIIWNFLVGEMGLSNVQAGGIMGNIKQESQYSPTALNPASDAYGIVQWFAQRHANLIDFAASKNKPKSDIHVQLEFLKTELEGSYKSSVLDPIKASSDLREITRIWLEKFEIPCLPGSAACAVEMTIRMPEAEKWSKKTGGGSSIAPVSGGCQGEESVGNASMKETITVNTPGRFITMPARYGCDGKTFKIDSRIAANVAYFVLKYNSCVTSGLEDGHNSHGAGLAVDMVPKDGSSKETWKNSIEAAARAIGWYGDGASDPKSSRQSCANYGAGDYGQCMHVVHPDKFGKWMRWLGYNGATCHGDPWHIYGGCGAHLHIGWDTPNGDGVSPTVISSPRESVYTFPSPIPEDLKDLVD